MPRTKEAFDAIRESTRQKIEAAALSLFARKGLSVTVEEIARTSGFSKGLLYNHYPSKEMLIIEFVKRAISTSSNAISEVVHNDTTACSKIEHITFQMCQIFLQHTIGVDYFMFMVQVDMSGMKIPNEVLYTADLPSPIESLALIIEQGQAEGSVVKGDAIQLSIIYWATIQGLCCYAITGMPLSPDPKMLSRILLKENN